MYRGFVSLQGASRDVGRHVSLLLAFQSLLKGLEGASTESLESSHSVKEIQLELKSYLTCQP
jgi:hypothetical protein